MAGRSPRCQAFSKSRKTGSRSNQAALPTREAGRDGTDMATPKLSAAKEGPRVGHGVSSAAADRRPTVEHLRGRLAVAGLQAGDEVIEGRRLGHDSLAVRGWKG